MKTLKAFSCQGYNYLPQLIWQNETLKYQHCNKFHHSYHNKNKIVLLLLFSVNAAIVYSEYQHVMTYVSLLSAPTNSGCCCRHQSRGAGEDGSV